MIENILHAVVIGLTYIVFWGGFILVAFSPLWLTLFFSYRNKKRAKVLYGMDVLDLGKAVYVVNNEAVECDNFALDAVRGGFVLTVGQTSRLIKFDSFKKMFTRLNFRNPVVYMVTQDNQKAAVYFTSSAQSLPAIKANLITSFAFGEAISGAVLAKASGAMGAVYGQIFKDRVSLTENWLIYHKITAFKARDDRGTRMAFVFIFLVFIVLPGFVVLMAKLAG